MQSAKFGFYVTQAVVLNTLHVNSDDEEFKKANSNIIMLSTFLN